MATTDYELSHGAAVYDVTRASSVAWAQTGWVTSGGAVAPALESEPVESVVLRARGLFVWLYGEPVGAKVRGWGGGQG